MNRPQGDFWSRRKAQVAQEAEAAVPVEQPDDQLSDAELLAKYDLPDPDTLSLGDDIRGFMARAIPEHLRRRALRQLWRTNPVLACVDGLNDYDGDFTDAGGTGKVQTGYQIGKGMLAHIQHVAQQAEDLLANEDAPVLVSDVEETTEVPDMPESVTEVVAPDPVEEAAPVAPRRMRLRFDDDAEVGA